MSTTEETLTTEATKDAQPKGKAAFAAARASLDTEPEGEPESSGGEDTKPEQTVEEPETADQPKETVAEENDSVLTEAELSALPAKEQANARKWNAKLTQKAQDLSAREKELASWKPFIDAYKANPEEALTQAATQRGLKLSKAETEAKIDTATSETLAELPSELEFLRPVFDAFGKKLLASATAEIAPIKAAHSQMVSETAAAETAATVERFSAKYPGWQKHEAKMIELGKKFLPAAGSMGDFEYMETLLTLATSGTQKAEKTKEVLAKIEKAKGEVEPESSGISDVRVVHTMPTGLTSRNRLMKAAEAAERGEVWHK